MSSSDFFQRSDFSCTVEEIHQERDGSGFGSLLVRVSAGRVSANFSFMVSAFCLDELIKTIDVVREANFQLSKGEPVYVGRGFDVSEETEEGANGES
jgi:hypothetical protein